MSYIEQSDIDGMLPPDFSLQALDDDGDGAQDSSLWDKALAAAQDDIDGRLSASYSVPISAPIPPAIKHAAKILVLYYLYKRRGVADATNPWKADADDQHKKLDKIGDGTIALDLTRSKTVLGVVIGEPSRLYSEDNNLLV